MSLADFSRPIKVKVTKDMLSEETKLLLKLSECLIILHKQLSKVALSSGIIINCSKCKHLSKAYDEVPCKDCDPYDNKFELEDNDEPERQSSSTILRDK